MIAAATSTTARAPAPSRDLGLGHLPVAERGEAWRQAFRERWIMPGLPPVLEVQGRSFDLGGAMLVDTIHPRLEFLRDAPTIRRDGGDDLYLLTQLSGGFRIETDSGVHEVAAGRFMAVDIARPVRRLASTGRTLCLAVSRELMEDTLPGLELRSAPLPAGDWLSEHLRTFREHVPRIDAGAASDLLRSTLFLLRACAAPSPQHVAEAAPALSAALLSRARRYIRAHHGDPGLTPERIAGALGASRSSLYRAFEPEGGVAEAIRRARLEAARRALEDRADGRRIGEIAFACGFTSEAHFSRAVRQAFGAPPSSLRAAAVAARG